MMCLFMISVCPSVCGWYDELIFSLVPNVLKRTFQNSDVNLESRSDTKVLGMPWCLNTVSWKTLAICMADMLALTGIILTYLDKRSTNTAMASCPCMVRGSLTIKSRDTDSQNVSGTGRDWSNPAGAWFAGLFIWQLWHARTNDMTSSFWWGHQEIRDKFACSRSATLAVLQ